MRRLAGRAAREARHSMKFICESCKAKYQIGDDKVAGKTVRMKCRRCGNMIVVSASVTTEASVVARIAPPTQQAEPSVAGAMPDPVSVDSFAHTHVGDDDEERTMIMKAGVLLAKPGAAAGLKGAPPRPGGPAPRPGGGVTPIGAARSAPTAPRPASVAPLRGPSGGGSAAVARAPDATPNPQSVAPSLQRSLEQQQSAPQLRPASGEDWYVGVGGVPVGPVRLAVIREKAAAGQVHADSLVWREGFEEWQPLKKFPELLELVDAAQRSLRRPVPFGPHAESPRSESPRSESRPPVGPQPSAPQPSALQPSALQPSAPQPSAAAAAAAAVAALVAPVAPASAPARDEPKRLTEEPAKASPIGVLADPFAAPAVSGDAPASPGTPASAAPRAELAPEPVAAKTEVEADLPARHKKQVHPMAWAFVAMAAAFGGVAAYTLFLKPSETKVVIVEKSGAPGGATAAPEAKASDPKGPAPNDAQTAAPEPGATGGPAKVAGGGGAWSGGGTKPGDAKSASPVATFDNSGLAGPKVGGPQALPTSTGGSGGGGSLTASEIGAVVDKERPMIRRKCWQSALDARTNPNASSAKVNVSFTVSPSGSVSGVSASGGGDFPGLASCIQGKVSGWHFPASGGSQPVSVPFVFAAQ